MSFAFKNRIVPKGRVILPPSKSEAIRAALLLGLAHDDPERAVAGFAAPFCGDLCCALNAAKDMKDACVGESAALMRFLIPIQTALYGRVSISADEALLRRGCGELEECLGVSLAPIPGTARISRRAPVRGSRFIIDCSRSSQFLSGLLIALPLLKRDCEVIVKNGLVSGPYAEMTLDFVRLFGGNIEATGEGFITHPSRYSAPEAIPVTGDISYAAVFEAMDMLGGEVEIIGKSDSTRQPDKRFNELAGSAECDIKDCPDLFPLLAAVACAKRGDTVIRGTARLGSKESSRAAGAVSMINDLGGSAEAGEDFVLIHGRGSLKGGCCTVRHDHRLVFAAAVLAMISDSPVVIDDIECVNKSAPQFKADILRLTGEEMNGYDGQ